jgi:hypothetical protein
MKMFKSLIEEMLMSDNKFDISVFPVSLYNIEPIKILINNCIQSGQSWSNAEIVAVSPTIWLPDFLSNNIQSIKYVTKLPTFNIYKFENNDIIVKNYSVGSYEFNNDKDLNDFFIQKNWSSLVIYSIVRVADLKTMTYKYNLRCADITEEYEVRDKKLNEILK